MDLKFFLNKFLKVDNIEHYTFKTLLELKNCYEDFMEKSEGSDPDFPMSNFGGTKGAKVGGMNIHRLDDEEREEFKERIVNKETGKVNRPEKPEAKEEYYEDKRKKMSSEERALQFLKNNNLRSATHG